MKKIQYIIVAALLLLGFMNHVTAQQYYYADSNRVSRYGWNQGRSGIYSVGLGGTGVIGFGSLAPFYTGMGLALNISGEYRVQRFIGLGFETGVDVLRAPYSPPPVELPPPYRYVSLGIPLVLKCNVHILDAAGVPIADRLDVYAGLNVGAGPAFYTSPGGGVFGFVVAGPQIGLRYWFCRQAAVFGEFGWGATFANVGFSF
jgi:hypothetical protein